jgi:hypothetical protein
VTNKEKYRQLCSVEMSIPIFSKDWWLDSVAGGDWDVVLVEKGGEILASMPYTMRNSYGLTLINQPLLTQNLGPWLRKSSAKYAKRLSQEKDLLQDLFKQLPSFSSFKQNWHCSKTNWLPLYWMGFEQTTKYTYVISNIKDYNTVFKDFENSKRKNIKKSEKIINVKFDISPEDFYKNHKLTLSKQRTKISYSFDVFKNLYSKGYKNNSAKTIAAYDKDGNLHAALFIVWDSNSAYDLISTIDPDYRTFGAASLLVQEAIKYVSKYVDKFDFEGSMIEPVERSFRQFGAIQTPYFTISKTNSKLLKTYRFLQDIKR